MISQMDKICRLNWRLGVVSRTILQAVRTPKPKTRYATGGGANLILFLRRVLSNRGFDATMRYIESRAVKAPG